LFPGGQMAAPQVRIFLQKNETDNLENEKAKKDYS
jgi:hypothetical protein